MKELLRAKGFKVTAQRELIFRSFLALGKHVSVDELYRRVAEADSSIGYSTVWRNLKLICRVGLAEEVNIGDGVTRYDPVTGPPHGHLYCLSCGRLVEFSVDRVVGQLSRIASGHKFTPETFKVEVQGYCAECRPTAGLSERRGKASGNGDRRTRRRTARKPVGKKK